MVAYFCPLHAIEIMSKCHLIMSTCSRGGGADGKSVRLACRRLGDRIPSATCLSR